ncbi:MAG: AMP-binding protein [bacterium]|nr:AMP-binding protein [bacterium]
MDRRRETPVTWLKRWAEARADEIFLSQPLPGGGARELTWREVDDQAHRLAAGLRDLGLARGARIGLLSQNCAEWFVTDLALMVGGYVSVPIYPTANADTIRYTLRHSGARAVFVGKLDDDAGQEPGIGTDLLRIGLPYETLDVDHTWGDLIGSHTPRLDEPGPEPEDVMTIVYTSGSTGAPKGAVRTFASMAWSGDAICRDLDARSGDRLVSYLPLAHITERTYIEMTALCAGLPVGFVDSRESFTDDVCRARPTLFISIPRLWKLFRDRAIEKIGPRRFKLMSLFAPTRKLLGARILRGLGLDHARVLGSGSAPISPALLEWYAALGIEICEAWGMTEVGAYATISLPFRRDKIGSCGRPALDSEVRVSDRGELLFRGPGMMREYLDNPEATAAALGDDGFFHTGDHCRIDEDDYVWIDGRLGDNFKTTRGKWVAPLPIEQRLDRLRVVDRSCVIGARLSLPVALVQLVDDAAARRRDGLRARFATVLNEINRGRESHERLDAIVVVADTWTTTNDVLTPTSKIRRHVLEERFGERVQGARGGKVYWLDEL